jgi:hypothetical protein
MINKSVLLLCLASFTTFAQQCLESKQTVYKNGIMSFQSVQNYDDKGKLIKKSETNSGNDNYYTTEYTYEYDSKGNNTKVIFKQNNVFKNITLKQYSSTGILISEELSNDEKVNPIQKTTFTNNIAEKTFPNSKNKERKEFDNDGKILKVEYIDENNTVKRSTKNDFDTKGNLLKITQFDAFDKLTIETNYEYDSKNNISKETTSRNGNLYNQSIFEYNSVGKLIKKTRKDASDKTEYFYTYEYNQINQMTREVYWYNNKIVNYTTHQYDSKGNKTKEEYFTPTDKIVGSKEWEYVCQ